MMRTMKSHQSGAALIVVMIFLVAIVVVGTLAIRQGMVTLNIATNSQAQQLMLQNSDAAFFNVEVEENIIKSLGTNGMFGYISGAANKDNELVFCYRGTDTEFFDLNTASMMLWQPGQTAPTNSQLGLEGYCSTTAAGNFFTSGRRAVMTQVAVKFSSQAGNDPFSGYTTGTDEKAIKFERSKPVKVFAVSVMPTLTTASGADIDECFQNHMSEVSIPNGTSVPSGAASRQSVTECLTNLNVPFTSYVSEYIIAQNFV